ncbi:MAG: chitobiase/beta-hexosaminidase C-terminal domain-containing protein, partial [Muribaculaceae bacterium]|nr:chitobiase/beta-hexosaminidase C-terminal domain-containing protein [Muribaculaceae bacterium]
KSQVLTNASVTQKELYQFTSEEFNVEGDFTILIKNLSPSNSTSNKDRVSIWDLTWTSFGEAPAVATPTFEMVEQYGGFVVTMSCATEGAEIHYTTNGSEPDASSTKYTSPIEVWMETTFKAVAVKDGELSNVATFTATPPYILEGFSDLYDFMEMMEPNQKVPVVVNGNMTAMYQNGQYTFVKCGANWSSSYMLVYGNMGKTISNGDTFNRLEGNFEVYSGQPEITSPSIVGEVTAGTPVEPEALYDLSEVASYNLNHYVTIENVSISGVNGKSATLTDAEGNSRALYNRFDIELDEVAGCTITGFVTINNGNIQLWPAEITGGQEAVAAPTFNPASGSIIPLYSEISISAEEGDEIYYMIEGFSDEFELYAGPEYAYSTGTMTIQAYAKKGDAVSETVTATYTVSKPSPELAWINAVGEPVSEVIWVIDGTPEQQILPEPYGMLMGEPTLTSSNPEVASINMEYMSIEVHKTGETIITLSVEETYQYAAEEASFLLKVITLEDAQNVTATVEFSNAANEGFTASAKDKTWESTDGTFLFKATAAVSGASTYPAVNSGQLRIYGTSNNTITVSAPVGYKIKEVSFNVDQNGETWLPTVDGEECVKAETATLADAVVCSLSLPTAAEQITIGCGGTTKHIRLNSISFVLTPAPSAIDGIEAEAADAEAVYYNLQGVRVENPAAGLYIRHQGGKASKVVIR